MKRGQRQPRRETTAGRFAFDGARRGFSPSRETGVLSKWRVGSRSPAAWSPGEIELQALATLATLAQISTPSAAHFLKSHQLLVQKFAADRDRQRSSFKPFQITDDCVAR